VHDIGGPTAIVIGIRCVDAYDDYALTGRAAVLGPAVEHVRDQRADHACTGW
jgi:hypothetical protein